MLTFIFKHPLVLALGFGLIVLALYLGWRKHNLLLTGHLAEGEVVEMIPHHGRKGGTTYSLRIAYTQSNGEKGEFTTGYNSNPPMHAFGEKIRVVCYAGDTKPDILAFPELFLFPWTLLCAGVFILLMCTGFACAPSLIDSTYLPPLANPDSLRALNLRKD